ncbi:MAG: FHIPEP family type III secretion protein [Enterobacter hormaechei]
MRGRETQPKAEPAPVKMPENTQAVEATWNDVQLEDSLDGSGVPPDPDGGFPAGWRTAWRIRSIRKKFAQDMGFLPPVVHIRDNMDLPPARYRIDERGGNRQR